MLALGLAVLGLSGTAFFHNESLRGLRVGLYVALGFSGALPIGHALALRGWEPATRLMVGAAGSTGGIYLFGCVFYLSRFPESFMPGKFDRIGSSHNVWHALIVTASLVHYALLLELWHVTHAARGISMMIRTIEAECRKCVAAHLSIPNPGEPIKTSFSLVPSSEAFSKHRRHSSPFGTASTHSRICGA
mmetsp:Transcript_15478/g.35902  ORF Transcript_15478/g.35902 Transcript_15478/m.35902 type:complete len:190 (-) Transcript_15478:19-588(-)